MEKALNNLELILPKTNWRSRFEIVKSIPGVKQKFDSIASENDVEKILDTLTEIKFAIIFAHIGFHVEIEPFSNKHIASVNPDLKITRDGYSSIVEIKRFRAPGIYSPGLRLQPFPKKITKNNVLQSYGNPIKDIQKIYNEIENKFKQAGQDGIIAFWNSNDELSPIEFQTAARRFLISSNIHQKASFVLLRGDPEEKFCCYKLREQIEPHQELWISELEQVIPDFILHRISIKS